MSVLSGLLTVCVHARFLLVPVKTHGAPANVAPMILVPSSLSKWTSYQDVGPSKGWWVLTAMYVSPFFVLFVLKENKFEPSSFLLWKVKLLKLFSNIALTARSPSLEINSCKKEYLSIFLGVIGNSFFTSTSFGFSSAYLLIPWAYPLTTSIKFLSIVLYKLSIISSERISWDKKSTGAPLKPIYLLNREFPAKYASWIVLKSSSECTHANP